MNHIGKECTFDALGRKWTAARQGRRVLIEFGDWARPLVPNPVRSALEDIDIATAKDAEILRELTRQDLAEEAKAKAEGREPVLIRPLYKPIANDMVARAQQAKNCYRDINHPEILSLMNSFKGQSYLLFLLLRKAHPDITQDTVDDILEELPGSEVARILKTTSGENERPAPKNDQAPAE